MKLRILPDNVELEVARGKNLLEAVTEEGIPLDASCGGAGVCGQCRVKLVKGELRSDQGARLTQEDIDEGWRQACQSEVLSDVTIEIPDESRIDSEVIVERKETPSGQYLTEEDLAAMNPGWNFEPPLTKIFLRLPPPTSSDNISDLDRLSRSLRQEHGIKRLRIDTQALRELPKVLRDGQWEVTVTLILTRSSDAFLEKGEETPLDPMLIRVEPGDATGRHFALAIDIGTTTVSGQVIDLAHNKVRCTLNEYNAQVQYGADVISRIVYALKPGGLETMQARVVGTINKVISQLSKSCGVDPQDLSHLAAAGNTTMTHFLLGLYPRWLRESPYVPVISRAGSVMASELGIDIGPWARIYTFPSAASYVGGDITAGILATGMYKRDEMSLLIDIGTNGEMAVGNRDFIVTASASAGPAFEGGGITCGMHAGPGAIERFKIDPLTYEVRYDTIRLAPARGVCGSGLINAVASLVEAGLIEPNGKVNILAQTPLTREGMNGPEIVIAPAGKTHDGADLVLTEGDLDNFIRAKAAMYAGYSTLLEHVGMSFADIQNVFLAGNFGNTLDIEHAVTIGLLPDIDRDKFQFVGNSSLRGARLVCQSSQLLKDAELIGRMMTNVEFWDNPRFLDHYTASMFLPHTNSHLFPTVTAKMMEFRKKRQN